MLPGWGRSPGEGNGNPLQYSCLGSTMDRGAWRTTVHGVTKESVGHNLATNQLTIKITTLLLFNVFPSTFHQQFYTPKHYYQDSKAQEKYKPPISSLCRHKYPSPNSQQHLYLIKSPCQLKEEKCEMVPLKLSNFTSLSFK